MRKCLFTLLFVSSLAAAQSPVTGIVHTPDVDLAYEIYGAPSSAMPVIIANGGPGFSHTYLLQNDVFTTRLASNRQIVLYDQRGDGKSKLLKPDAPQGMDAQVADLDAIRAKLGFQKFDLVGHSCGGLLAMGYASAHPEHIDKLVLIDSAAPAWKGTLFLFDKVFPDVGAKDEEITKKLGHSPEAAKEHLANYFSMLFYSQENHDRFLVGVTDLGENNAVNAAVGKAIAGLDLNPELPKFHFPTLIMHGRFDMNVAVLTGWKTYRAIPGARIVIFAKSGHLPFYEEPDRFTQVLNNFLSGR
ncbi:MAG: alpha/beta fold hydrolase [Edaphobacter sp.]